MRVYRRFDPATLAGGVGVPGSVILWLLISNAKQKARITEKLKWNWFNMEALFSSFLNYKSLLEVLLIYSNRLSFDFPFFE